MTSSELDHRLLQLREALAGEAPPPCVDEAIARAIAARAGASAPARRSRRQWSWPRAWLIAPGAIAAAVLALLIAHRVQLPTVSTPDVAAAPAGEMAGIVRGGPFIPLVSLSELEDARDAVVVSTTLPRLQLSELGVPVDPAGAVDAIDAEFLVRADGAVLAVRLSR